MAELHRVAWQFSKISKVDVIRLDVIHFSR